MSVGEGDAHVNQNERRPERSSWIKSPIHLAMTVFSRLCAFADSVEFNHRAVGGEPEERIKGPIKRLVEGLGEDSSQAVSAAREYHFPGLRAIPDFGIELDGNVVGFIEAKAPGKGARTERFTGNDRTQWRQFKELPVIAYTDGIEWALYQQGRRTHLFVLPSELITDGGDVITDAHALEMQRLIDALLRPAPIVPSSPKELAEVLAPLCRRLRDAVLVAVRDPESMLARQAAEWRTLLFADADDQEFADAYAQTVTYALLLARMDGGRRITHHTAVDVLADHHGLMARALRALTDVDLRPIIHYPLSLLQGAINNVDPGKLRRHGRDPWVYFYESFLAAYDKKLRKNRGVYYTPIEVVQAQVRIVEDLLRTRLGRADACADEDVVILDPAAGTGTYLLHLADHTLSKLATRYGRVDGYATDLARRLVGFEILVGPYSVAHMRLTQALADFGGTLPRAGARVYLGNTLEAPEADRQIHVSVLQERLAEEHRRVRQVKSEEKVLVCIGNPPYDRQHRDDDHERRKGAWLRFAMRRDADGHLTLPPLLDDFLRPVRDAGGGGHLKNVYNDYVYFWRWALWKVLEQQEGPGIVSFITASSFLLGPGFAGMREHMRRAFDEIWIIDLGGDNRGTRRSENVFDIQTPVCITTGIRVGAAHTDTPATCRYVRFSGSRAGKLERLATLTSTAQLEWVACSAAWGAPLLPKGRGTWESWPRVSDILPWSHTGAEFQRTWPIAPSKGVLVERWDGFLASEDRRRAFGESRDRKIHKSYRPLLGGGPDDKPLAEEPAGAPHPAILPFGFRSFQRWWCLADNRIGTVLKPALWSTLSGRQLYMTSLLTGVVGTGPAATVSTSVPDKHHFRGSFGGKDCIPLWRDAAATQPNLTAGLDATLQSALGLPVTPEDIFAWCYAILANPSYTTRFWDELGLPGPRIPLTKDAGLWARGVKLGEELVRWHTYGQRWAEDEPGFQLDGRARWKQPVPQTEAGYPTGFRWFKKSEELHVGAGIVERVPREVYEFEVSGLMVVESWLKYRMKGGAGRRSSPLDEIRDVIWPNEYNRELLELLWVLEHTAAMAPLLDSLLEDVLAGPLLTADQLPVPDEVERLPPSLQPGTPSHSSDQTTFGF